MRFTGIVVPWIKCGLLRWLSGKEPTCQCKKHEMRVWSLGQEDPLEKEMEAHSSILAWRILWTEKPGGLQSMVSQRVRYAWATHHQQRIYVQMFKCLFVACGCGVGKELILSSYYILKSPWLSYKSRTLIYNKRYSIENQKGRKWGRLPGFLEASCLFCCWLSWISPNKANQCFL